MASDNDRDTVSALLGTIVMVSDQMESEIEDEKLSKTVLGALESLSDKLEDWQYNEGAEGDDDEETK